MKNYDEIHLEIENSCLLNCMHCSSSSLISSGNSISYSINDVISFIRLFDDELYIILTGGEPLLNSNLHVFISELFNNSCTVGLFTSGLICQPNGVVSEISINYAKFLKNCGLSFCYVSVYSFEECYHDSITGITGSFEKTIKSIKNLISAGVKININHILLKGNINKINENINFFDDLGVESIRLLKLVKHGNAALNWNSIGFQNNEQEYVLQSIARSISSYHINITIAGVPELVACRPFQDSIKCQAGSRLFYVDYSGNVFPCACVKNNEKYKIGHLLEIDHLNEYINLHKARTNNTCLNKKVGNNSL